MSPGTRYPAKLRGNQRHQPRPGPRRQTTRAAIVAAARRES